MVGRPKKERKTTDEIHVALERDFLNEINDYVEQSSFKSRTQFVVFCIKEELQRQKDVLPYINSEPVLYGKSPAMTVFDKNGKLKDE